jgi:hypothetical protein
MGKLPRGLAYLAKLLDEPGNEQRTQALHRFQRYLDDNRPLGHAFGSPTPLDRATAAELADTRRGDLLRIVSRRPLLEMTAGTMAVIFKLAIAANVSPKGVFSALMHVGLEAIADDLRINGAVRPIPIVQPTSAESASARSAPHGSFPIVP